MKHDSISLAGGEVSAAAARIQAMCESGRVCPHTGRGLRNRVLEAGRLAAAGRVSPDDARRVAEEAENVAVTFSPPEGVMTDVYWNRRLRPRAWSVREGGRVNRHVRTITLRDVRFIVHVAAVARVQALRQHAVCAYARGIPYAAAAFTTEDGFPVLRASLAHFEEDGSCWCVL